jgi:hypothetical protein
METKNDDDVDMTVCLICRRTYTEPKLLPCGETACFDCLRAHFASSKNKCFFCNEQHEIQSLPTVKILARQCENKRSSLRNLSNEFIHNLDKIHVEAYNLREFINLPEISLTEFCADLIASIEAHRDLIITKIKKDASDLIQNVREKETSSKNKIKESLKDKKAVIEDFIDELEYFHHSWTKKVASYDLENITTTDFNKLSNACSQVSELFVDVDAAKDYLSSAVSFEKIQFVKNTGFLSEARNVLGELSMPCDGMFQSDEIKSHLFQASGFINLDKAFVEIDKKCHGHLNKGYFILQIKLDLIVCFYLDTEGNLNAIKLNNKGQVLEIYNSIFTNCAPLNFLVKYSHSTETFIIVVAIQLNKHLSRHVYVSDAETLAIQSKSMTFKQSITHVCVSDVYIFIKLTHGKYFQLAIMDMKLDILKLIHSTKFNLDSDSSYFSNMFIDNGQFIIVYQNLNKEAFFKMIPYNILLANSLDDYSSCKTIRFEDFYTDCDISRYRLDISLIVHNGYFIVYQFEKQVFKLFKIAERNVFFERTFKTDFGSNFLIIEKNPCANILLFNIKSRDLFLFDVNKLKI